MGRPPSNGGPSFRFNPNEVAEMEGILQAHNCLVPQREILVALADKFSNSAERSGRAPVQMKQVWNWFQNRRYALRAKSAKPLVKLSVSPMPQHDSSAARNVSQAPQHPSVPAANVRNVPQVPQPVPTPMVQSVGKNGTDNSQMEFEAKSARDGAWYDVATFLSHRSVETNDPEVLVRFAGFGPEEDEWVNVRKHVRQRSLPCESSECVAVLPGDLILCFQEGKEQALYFDAHVLDAQRRRHDVRGCRCRFLVRYDHDQSEEIVPLRKVCRRPETDYRMQQLHADSGDMKQNKTGSEPHDDNNVKAYPPVEVTVKQHNVDGPAETIPKPANAEMPADSGPLPVPVSFANISVTTSVAPTAHSIEPSASATIWSPHSNVSVATTLALDPNSRVPGTSILAPLASKIPVMPAAAPIANSGDPGATIAAPVASSVPLATTVAPVANSSVPGATIMAPCDPDVHTAPAGVPVADFSVPTVPNMPSAANSTVPLVPTAALAVNSSVPGATVMDPVASSIHVAKASIPDANSSAPIVPTTAPAANANVHVSETQAPGANSIAPTIPNMVPTANSSVPIDPTVAPTANSGAPTASIAEAPLANSCIPVAMTSEAPFATNSGDHIAPTVVPLADSSAPTALSAEAPITNSSVSVVMTTEAPFATNSSVHIAPTGAPPADSSVSTALEAEAPIANCSVPVAMATEASFATNSSVHIAPTMAPASASSAPTALNAEAPLADSSVPVAMTTDTPFAISSSVHLAVTPADHSSAPSALSAEAPIANSDVPVAMSTEASFATNSSVPGASDVPQVTENVLLEKFPESGSAGNVENTNAQSPNLAIASGTDTSAIPEEEAGESMQLG